MGSLGWQADKHLSGPAATGRDMAGSGGEGYARTLATFRELGDLLAVLGFVGLVWTGAYVAGSPGPVVRLVAGIVFLFFLPGYAAVSAIFPGRRHDGVTIDGIERATLSCVASIVLVTLVGLAITAGPIRFRFLTVFGGLSAVTVLFALVACYRRWRLPSERRFSVSGEPLSEKMDERATAASVLTIVVACFVLAAMGSVAYSVATPQQPDPFTEFYLLTESDDGTLVADDYPTEVQAGQSPTVHLGIENREGRSINYTVVQVRQRLNPNGTEVLNSSEVRRHSVAVDSGEASTQAVTLPIPSDGRRFRFVFLLYRGTPPADPSVANADRELHLSTNVSRTTGS